MMKEKREVMECNMEQKKEKNKGFSLVELIVVIAIMAILAVVIAPQVIKYIGKSKDSADAANMSLYKTAVTTALSDDTIYSKVAALDQDSYVIKVKEGVLTMGAGAVGTFENELKEILGETYPGPKSPDKNTFLITISIDKVNDKIGKIVVSSIKE